MGDAMELGIEYDDSEWPHGMRCAECDRLMQDGDRYSERLDGLTVDGTPIVLIVCVGCALASNQDSESA